MPGQRGNTCLSRGDEVARVTASCLSWGPSQNVAPTGRYHGNCLFAPFNPILSATRDPQLEVGEVGREMITCGLSLFFSPSPDPSVSPSSRGCQVHLPLGPHRAAVLCVVRARASGSRFRSGRQAGVGEAVTRATGTGRFGGGCHGDLDADEGSRGCEQPQCPAQKPRARQSSWFSVRTRQHRQASSP